ncbi:MAG: ribosome hibernation-promoting factor, HPF/YfiA family [Nitrospiria bacterium]
MEVVISGKQLEMTPALKEYVETRATKISKYTSKATQAVFTLKVEKYRHLAEVLVKVNGFILQAEHETDAMYASVDKAMGKIERQLRKYKEKLCDHRVPQNAMIEKPSPTQKPLHPSIDKKKKFPIQPMTESEAAFQMKLLKKNFFLFKNHKDQQLNVLYKRKDGGLGLIEPTY